MNNLRRGIERKVLKPLRRKGDNVSRPDHVYALCPLKSKRTMGKCATPQRGNEGRR